VKTDADLLREVRAELAWDPAVKCNAIDVAVSDGVVSLTGSIETLADRHAAERAVRRVAGVQAIAIDLQVTLAAHHQRSDADIAASATQALKWNTLVPLEQVELAVDQGRVTLRGEVQWDYQRRGIEKALRPLMGVVAISNEITLRAQSKAVDLSRKIEQALTRQALREARKVHVDVDGATVKLTGTVHSWKELEAVQGVAWSAPGVHAVINELRVQSQSTADRETAHQLKNDAGTD